MIAVIAWARYLNVCILDKALFDNTYSKGTPMSAISRRRQLAIVLLSILLLLTALVFFKTYAKTDRNKKEPWQLTTQNLRSTGPGSTSVEGIRPIPRILADDRRKPPDDLKPGLKEGDTR